MKRKTIKLDKDVDMSNRNTVKSILVKKNTQVYYEEFSNKDFIWKVWSIYKNKVEFYNIETIKISV